MMLQSRKLVCMTRLTSTESNYAMAYDFVDLASREPLKDARGNRMDFPGHRHNMLT